MWSQHGTRSLPYLLMGPHLFSAPASKRGASEGEILTKNSYVENMPAQATGGVTQGLRTAPTEPPFSEAFSRSSMAAAVKREPDEEQGKFNYTRQRV
jgi:hypothetical protein